MNDQPFERSSRDAAFTLRDHFAAAALTGFIRGFPSDSIFHLDLLAKQSYEVADAMLHERDKTNHDAAPAARATTKPGGLNSGSASGTSGEQSPVTKPSSGTGNTWSPLFNPKPGEILPKAVVGLEYDEYLREHVAKMGDGKTAWKDLPKMSVLLADYIVRATDWLKDKPQAKQPAPPCVETDGFSPGSSGGQINRNAERESPRRECGESSLRDVARPDTKGKVAGGPEHHISEAEIDALEFVVEEGRIANIDDYGILRSMLIRLRQEWEFSDSPEPIKDAVSDSPEPIRIDLSHPCMVDPPSGWKWGFPRRYDPASDGPMKEWLIRNGYPKHLADKGLTCTFTLCDKETTDK